MKQLFGTDGIRGVAGEAPLDPVGVRKFGWALGEVLQTELGRPARVVLGRDTRESGTWLRDAVSDGLAARAADSVDAGVITTPGLAHVVQAGGFDAGVMISASHNPFQDNGLKVFSATGIKLSDELERQIESHVLQESLPDPGERGGGPPIDSALLAGYEEKLRNAVPEPSALRGLRVGLDCANGSASGIAPALFRSLGIEVETLGDAPNGHNINLNCGSLHLDRLAETTRQRGWSVGLAFDGDADRCLAVDQQGRVVDGDHILYITARGLRRRNGLRGDGVVATVMSNFWLEERLEREGIRLVRAPVGDKYVLERMLAEDLVLGGEQSGHVIFREHATTGDGILTGLLLLELLRAGDEPLERILDSIVPFPQLLVNVRVQEKPDLRRHATIGPVVAEVERNLHGQGRVVLRYSGTEPLARVMVEARGEELVRREVKRLADAIRAAIGS